MISYTLLCPTVVFLRWRTNDSTFCFAMSRKCTRVHTALLCYELVTIASTRHYWAIQAGLLTPLIFARHRLSSLAAFTSGAYFLHNGRRWQWICEFYTANVKGIFLRHVVIMCLEISNNLLLVLWDAPKRIFSTNSRSSDQPQNDAKTLFVHPPSPFHGHFCKCNSIGICTTSQF